MSFSTNRCGCDILLKKESSFYRAKLEISSMGARVVNTARSNGKVVKREYELMLKLLRTNTEGVVDELYKIIIIPLEEVSNRFKFGDEVYSEYLELSNRSIGAKSPNKPFFEEITNIEALIKRIQLFSNIQWPNISEVSESKCESSKCFIYSKNCDNLLQNKSHTLVLKRASSDESVFLIDLLNGKSIEDEKNGSVIKIKNYQDFASKSKHVG